MTEHDEYNELLSIVGDIVDAGHMDQEGLARLRAHLGALPLASAASTPVGEPAGFWLAPIETPTGGGRLAEIERRGVSYATVARVWPILRDVWLAATPASPPPSGADATWTPEQIDFIEVKGTELRARFKPATVAAPSGVADPVTLNETRLMEVANRLFDHQQINRFVPKCNLAEFHELIGAAIADYLAAPIEAEAQKAVVWQFKVRAAEPWCWITCNRETFEQCSAKPEVYEVRPLGVIPTSSAIAEVAGLTDEEVRRLHVFPRGP